MRTRSPLASPRRFISGGDTCKVVISCWYPSSNFPSLIPQPCLLVRPGIRINVSSIGTLSRPLWIVHEKRGPCQSRWAINPEVAERTEPASRCDSVLVNHRGKEDAEACHDAQRTDRRE